MTDKFDDTSDPNDDLEFFIPPNMGEIAAELLGDIEAIRLDEFSYSYYSETTLQDIVDRYFKLELPN